MKPPSSPRTSTRTPLTAGRTIGAAALATALGLGASAVSGSAFAAGGHAAEGRPVRMADLVSPADVAAATGIGTVSATEGRAPRAGVSACTGEQRMADLLPDAATVLAGHFSGHLTGRAEGRRVEVGEVAGDHAPPATYRRLVRELRGCQHEPATHWHYGAVHHVGHGETRTVWMPTFDGDGARDGGVVAAWSHHHLAVAEVRGTSAVGVARVAAAVGRRLG